jgi:flagellar biosynthesis/type III secretory pathway protein FliH
MAGMGLNAAKAKLQDIQNALQKALKEAYADAATLPTNEKFSKMSNTVDNAAKRFADTAAQKAAPDIATAILNFITQAQITGTINGVVTATCAVGPAAGTNIDILTGTELSLI